jgi:hypothetical protein
MRLIPTYMHRWLAMPVILLAAILFCHPVMASYLQTMDYINSKGLITSDKPDPIDITETYQAPIVEKPDELDDVMFIIQKLVEYENYDEFLIYNPKLKGKMPLDKLARVLFVYSAWNPNRRMIIEANNSSKGRIFSNQNGKFWFMFAPPKVETWGALTYSRALGQVELNERQQKKQRFFSWLNEGTGLFSGAQWSSENILPRLLTICGFVFGLILLIEIFRLVLGVGTAFIRTRSR